MPRKTRIADLPDFDMAQQLKSEEDIAAYVTCPPCRPSSSLIYFLRH